MYFIRKPRAYHEAILIYSDSTSINHTRESSNDISSVIIYSKAIIKRIIKPTFWGFELQKPNIIKIGES